MTKEELGKKVYEVAYITGEFLLRSGVISNEYFDKYQFESRPDLLKEIAEQMIPLLPQEFDVIAGLEMGGIPIATALSLETGKPVVFVRKKAKEYGTCKFAEGVPIKNKKVVVIEDVVTSGGQVVISTEDLRKAGAEINLALCVIDRESTGRENLSKNNIELRSLYTMSYLKKLVNQ
jgi:orotate phosphoribosyltransferase